MTPIDSLHKLLMQFGINGNKFIKGISNLGSFFEYYKNYKELMRQKGNDQSFPLGTFVPIITDRNEEGGTMSGHYFHQDLYVARKVFLANAKKHVDIGSRTDGFVAHVASFRQIELVDIRPIKSKIKNIAFRQMDLMELPPNLLNYCDSISSLHAIEHFGLGRYGDPINYNGHLKVIENIGKILSPEGYFYFSVPIGPQRIEFNAHRVFSVRYLMEILRTNFTIEEFSYVNDAGDFFENIEMTNELVDSNFGCDYGCGIFILKKQVAVLNRVDI